MYEGTFSKIAARLINIRCRASMYSLDEFKMDTKEFKFICGLVLVFVIIIGVFGNVISFIIWRKGKRCRTLPGSVYLIALAVSDIFVLCMTATYYAVNFIFEINLTDLNVFLCKLLNTTWHFTLLVSTWIVVCLTIERVLAVCWPLKSASWTGRRKPMIVLAFVVCVCFLPNLPWTIGTQLLPASRNGQKNVYGTVIRMNSNHSEATNGLHTNITDERTRAGRFVQKEKLTCQSETSSFIYKYENEWHKWFIDFCLLYSFPLVIITASNVMILNTVCRRSNTLKTSKAYSYARRSQAVSTSMTARVIAISVVHCISVGPYSIAVLIPDFVQNVDKIDSFTCMYVIFTFIWYINHGANFILYSLFGTAFRHDCYDLFCKRRSSGHSGIDMSKNPATEMFTVSSIVYH